MDVSRVLCPTLKLPEKLEVTWCPHSLFFLRILLFCPLGRSQTGFRDLHLYAGRTPAMTPQHKLAASVVVVTGPRRWAPLKSHIQSPEGQSKHQKLLDWKKSRLSTQAFCFLDIDNVPIIGHVDVGNGMKILHAKRWYKTFNYIIILNLIFFLF